MSFLEGPVELIDDWGFPIRNATKYSTEPNRCPKQGPLAARNARILEGLRRLAARRERRSFTLEEIAAACGVSDRYISKIETRALRKMRKILEHHLVAAELA